MLLISWPYQANAQGQLLTRDELQNAPVFYSLEAALGQPTEVLRLDLSADTTRTQLPATIGHLINLQELVLTNVPLERLPANLGQLRSLQILTLQHLQQPNEALVRLPEELADLEHLWSVNLIGNPKLDFVRAFHLLAQLPKLEILAIMNNRFTELPAEIRGMKALRQLWLGKNPRLKLSDTLEKLQALELTHLGLGGNGHEAIPDAVTGLKALKLFYLAGNPIAHLPDMSEMDQLEILNLSRFGGQSLPAGLETIRNLRTLVLDGNPGLDFVDTFARLGLVSTLEILSLSNSNLTKLPAGIEQLRQLRALYVRGNSLSEQEVERLRGLLPQTRLEH